VRALCGLGYGALKHERSLVAGAQESDGFIVHFFGQPWTLCMFLARSVIDDASRAQDRSIGYLENVKTTRRDLLASMTAMAVLPGAVLPGCGGKALGSLDTGDSGDPDQPDEPDDTGVPLEPAPSRSPEPEPWDADGTLDESAFAWGVQVGDPGPDSARVGLWTTEMEVGLVLMRGDGLEWVQAETQLHLLVEGGVLQLTLEALNPDTVYSLIFLSADGDRRSRVVRFRTALDADGWRKMTIGATSCLGSPNRPWPSMSLVADLDVDVFLLLGDMVYAGGANTLEDFSGEWSEALQVSGLQDVCAHSAIVTTWDDHEVYNNFEGENTDPVLLEAALSAYRRAIPQREGPGGTGLWRVLRWGAVLDVFVLDSRGERDGDTQYISEEQMAWLKAGLSESTARFKFIANSVPITDYHPMLLDALADDRWQGYPEQRTELLSFIEDENIGGVLWITGDFHFGTISKIGALGELGEDRWEVMVGPSGSTLNPLAEIYDNPEQFPVMFAAWNSTVLELDPARGEVAIRYIGDDGAVLAEKTLTI
jgi:hypothetical protein